MQKEFQANNEGHSHRGGVEVDMVVMGGSSHEGKQTIEDDSQSVESSASGMDNAPTMTAKQEAAKHERETLGRRESRAILCLRIAVVLLFLIIGLASGFSVYYYVHDGETDAFETEFTFYAERVTELFIIGMQRKMSAIDTLSVSITSYAEQSGSQFPFVTVPDFEYKGSNARITGDTVTVVYMPLVTEENKEEWEAYARNNSGHIVDAFRNENREKRAQDEKFNLTRAELDGIGADALLSGELGSEEGYIPGDIWVPVAPDDWQIPPPYTPVWQVTPILPPNVDLINLDFSKFDFVRGAMQVTLSSGEAALDVIADLTAQDTPSNGTDSEEAVDSERDGSDAVFDLMLDMGQYRHSAEDYLNDPLSCLIFPVFDSFRQDQQTVGALFTTLYWRLLFDNILPESIEGIVCVLENSAGQAATYRVNGPVTEFLGLDDLHDKEFDYLEETIAIGEYLKSVSSPETSSFTSVDLNTEKMEYTLRVYPSAEFRSIYVTGAAVAEGVVVGVIFGIAMLIFLLYDCFVSRRQRIVMDRAVKATAVVSSLFPEQVREQIINDDSNDVRKPNNRQVFRASQVGDGRAKAPAIATKFPDCTVFFADLAGFTKWSSTREPDQVFRLLEAMFKEFDSVALRRGVFKVETIGDCYMAVTGLPEPQEDHAVRMAKFASDCLTKLAEVTSGLVEDLGDGTDDLTLRIGMHSGEVTGGVLRGDKSRFQLFGDTVNTASRMESTGVPRMIQVSQTTADSLILHGKAGWLSPRKEKIVAKGKGEMQTYFLHLHANSSDKQSSSQQSSSTHPTSSQPESSSLLQ